MARTPNSPPRPESRWAQRQRAATRILAALIVVSWLAAAGLGAPGAARAGTTQAEAGISPIAGARQGGPGDGQGDLNGDEDDTSPTRPRLRLVEQTPWVTTDGDWALVVDVVDPPEGAVLAVTLHEQRRSRIQFNESLAGTPGARRDSRCATLLQAGIAGLDPCRIPVDDADLSEGGVTVVLPVRSGPGNPDRLPLPSDGVYPVQVVLEDPSGRPLDTIVTHLVRLPSSDDDSPPLAVNVVLPVQLPPALQPDGEVVLEPAGLAAIGELASILAAHTDVPVVLVPAPDTLMALDQAGHDDVLADLAAAAADDQVLARPAVDVDVGSWWAASLDTDLERLLTLGRDRVADTLEVRPDPRTWWVEPTTDEATLARLRASGVDQLVVSEDLVDDVDLDVFTLAQDRPFEVATDDGGRVPTVMADAALGAHLGSTDDPLLDAHHLLTDLALLYFQQPAISRGVAVELPADPTLIPPAFLDALLDGLASAPMLTPTTVDDLLANADRLRVGGSNDLEGPVLTRRLRTQPPPDLGTYPAELENARAALSPYLSMTQGEVPPLTVDLLDASADRRLDAEARTAYLESAVAQLVGLADAVAAPPQASVTLTARQGLIPVEVVNLTEEPVRVLVRLESDKLDFPDSDARILDLAPGANRLEWEVRARTSGAFPVDLVITSPDAALELDRSRFTMRSTAVSGIGVALSGLAALFLGVWWIRHWHASRNVALVDAAPLATGEVQATDDGPAGRTSVPGSGAARDPAPIGGRVVGAEKHGPGAADEQTPPGDDIDRILREITDI